MELRDIDRRIGCDCNLNSENSDQRQIDSSPAPLGSRSLAVFIKLDIGERRDLEVRLSLTYNIEKVSYCLLRLRLLPLILYNTFVVFIHICSVARASLRRRNRFVSSFPSRAYVCVRLCGFFVPFPLSLNIKQCFCLGCKKVVVVGVRIREFKSRILS